MVKIHSKPLDKTIDVERVIGHIEGAKKGPTIIFTAGIHGNEPSGIFALKQVIEALSLKKRKRIKGNIFALSGNLSALSKGLRYHKQDLNRLWTKLRLQQVINQEINYCNEDVNEMIDIYSTIQNIMKKYSGPYYFMDLHTTSSESIPFLTVNDSLLNRDFVSQYPLPIILGIEEFLEGPILSYINELGYVSFGFEAGQHDGIYSIDNHKAFIYLSLVFAGVINKKTADYHRHYEMLAKTSIDSQGFYEVFYRHNIKEDDIFKMNPGFVNFQKIRKNQMLAVSNGDKITAHNNSKIFMPLYQDQGEDGFYKIRKIRPVFLRLSRTLRKIKFDNFLSFLPGIHWANPEKNTLLVNLKIARFFAKPFFHLLGYRSIQKDKTHLILQNREAASRNEEYKEAIWKNK
jgi:succinylglutamate desuccinylase